MEWQCREHGGCEGVICLCALPLDILSVVKSGWNGYHNSLCNPSW